MPRGNPAVKLHMRVQPSLIARLDAIARELAAHRPQALEFALDQAERALLAERQLQERKSLRRTRKPPGKSAK